MLLELLVGSEDVVSILADVSCPLKQHVLQACYQCLVMFFETHTTARVLPCDQFPAVGGWQIAQNCLQPVLPKSLGLVCEVI